MSEPQRPPNPPREAKSKAVDLTLKDLNASQSESESDNETNSKKPRLPTIFPMTMDDGATKVNNEDELVQCLITTALNVPADMKQSKQKIEFRYGPDNDKHNWQLKGLKRRVKNMHDALSQPAITTTNATIVPPSSNGDANALLAAAMETVVNNKVKEKMAEVNEKMNEKEQEIKKLTKQGGEFVNQLYDQQLKINRLQTEKTQMHDNHKRAVEAMKSKTQMLARYIYDHAADFYTIFSPAANKQIPREQVLRLVLTKPNNPASPFVEPQAVEGGVEYSAQIDLNLRGATLNYTVHRLVVTFGEGKNQVSIQQQTWEHVGQWNVVGVNPRTTRAVAIMMLPSPSGLLQDRCECTSCNMFGASKEAVPDIPVDKHQLLTHHPPQTRIAIYCPKADFKWSILRFLSLTQSKIQPFRERTTTFFRTDYPDGDRLLDMLEKRLNAPDPNDFSGGGFGHREVIGFEFKMDQHLLNECGTKWLNELCFDGFHGTRNHLTKLVDEDNNLTYNFMCGTAQFDQTGANQTYVSSSNLWAGMGMYCSQHGAYSLGFANKPMGEDRLFYCPKCNKIVRLQVGDDRKCNANPSHRQLHPVCELLYFIAYPGASTNVVLNGTSLCNGKKEDSVTYLTGKTTGIPLHGLCNQELFRFYQHHPGQAQPHTHFVVTQNGRHLVPVGFVYIMAD